MASTQRGQYAGGIPAGAITGKEVEYYLKARDLAGSLSYEGTAATPHRVKVAQNPASKPW